MNQIEIHEIKNVDNPYFDEFWKVYSESFPLNERRTIEQQIRICEKPQYRINAYLSENQFIGFIAFWTNDEFVFVEHFAIVPEFRNRKLGSTILKLFVEVLITPVILEIDPPTDELTQRRLRFYELSGFVMNDHSHFQPPYHIGDLPLELVILTYPTLISSSCYQQFAQFQKEIVMI